MKIERVREFTAHWIETEDGELYTRYASDLWCRCTQEGEIVLTKQDAGDCEETFCSYMERNMHEHSARSNTKYQ